MFVKSKNVFWDKLTHVISLHYVWFARISFFIVYFWFGILKILGESPASPLVQALQTKTLPFLSFNQFIIFFSLYEMLIGVLFLIPKLTRLTYVLFMLHMITTMMPLFLLPEYSWQKMLVPTLEGQYMIKNLILIALASSILVNTKRREVK